MDAPKCRLCGTRHWARDRCSFGDDECPASAASEGLDVAVKSGTKTSLVLEPTPVKPPTAKPTSAGSVEGGMSAAQSGAPLKERFDRQAYQRDYMRDQRAADKLGMTVKEYRAKKTAGKL